MKPPKVKVTLRLEQSVYDAARLRAERLNAPVAVVLADAAKQMLLPEYQKEQEAELLKAINRGYYKLRRMEDRLGLDLHILKEMVGLHVRAYFNHTPAVPETEKDAASLSGRIRFERYLDLLARNIRPGASILASDQPQPDEPEEQTDHDNESADDDPAAA